MSTSHERLEELLIRIQQEELPTLQALDRRLHDLLKQKAGTPQPTDMSSVWEECHRHYPQSTIPPDLLALVGIHPANARAEDKHVIHEHIARSLPR